MTFLLTLCMTALAAALFKICAPGKKFSKQISLVIACVFVLCAFNTLTNAEFDAGGSYGYESTDEYVEFSREVNQSLQKKICKEMSDKLYALLNENEIYPDEIHVIVNISGLYGISITQVKLVFPAGSEDGARAAEDLLKNKLSEDIKLVTVVKR